MQKNDLLNLSSPIIQEKKKFSKRKKSAENKSCYCSASGFVVTRGRVLHTPRESAASMVATPLHGEIAPFRLISPPMKFPPQAVIGGSSPRTVFPKIPTEFPGGKTAR